MEKEIELFIKPLNGKEVQLVLTLQRFWFILVKRNPQLNVEE